MRRKNKFSFLLFIAIAIFMTASYSYAQPTVAFYGNAGSEVNGTYTVTMKKVEISQDGTIWVTLGEKELPFNIASGSAGATIGGYISNVAIPVGTYTRLRITQSRTITIKGRGSTGGTTYYTTTQNGSVTAGGTTFYKATANVALYEAVAFQVPSDATGQAGETITISDGDMIITKDMSATPIVINKGQSKAMSISFNAASMIGFQTSGADYIFFPMAPQQTYSES